MLGKWLTPDQAKGQRFGISLSAGAAEITTVNQVDWAGLFKTVYMPALIGVHLPQGYSEKQLEAWVKSATKKRSIVIPGPSDKKWQPPTETKKAVWKAVSGGIATVVFDSQQSGEYPQDFKKESDVAQASLEMSVATETFAWGFDLSPNYDSCRIRFAAVPKPEVSIGELINKFDTLRDEITNIAKETDMSDDDFAKHLLEQWKEMKVSIVNGKEVNGEEAKDYMLVEGECSGSLIKALNLSKMFKVAK